MEHIRDQINEHEGNMIAELYHSDMSAKVREGIYKDWKKGKFRVLIVTSTLGIGVDSACVGAW